MALEQKEFVKYLGVLIAVICSGSIVWIMLAQVIGAVGLIQGKLKYFVPMHTYIYFLVRHVGLRQPKCWCGPASNSNKYKKILNINSKNFLEIKTKNIENLIVLMLPYRPLFRI